MIYIQNCLEKQYGTFMGLPNQGIPVYLLLADSTIRDLKSGNTTPEVKKAFSNQCAIIEYFLAFSEETEIACPEYADDDPSKLIAIGFMDVLMPPPTTYVPDPDSPDPYVR